MRLFKINKIVSCIAVVALFGCNNHTFAEKPVSWLIFLDNTGSIPAEDKQWPLIMNGLLKYVEMQRGDQLAVCVIKENSRNQRPARLKYFRFRRRLDPEYASKNEMAMQRFKEKVKQLIKSSGNSNYSDIFGALNLGASYFSAVDTSFTKVMVVVSDGLHNTNNEREIRYSLGGVRVTWVGLNDENAPEYESNLKSAGAIIVNLLPRTGIDQLILGELKLIEPRRVEK